MNKDKNIELRIIYLTNLLLKHNYNYYVLDNPQISDDEYDNLFTELKLLESKYPEFIKHNSPTQIVGGKVSKNFDQIHHKIPMLSLENAFNSSDVISFDRKLHEKLDIPNNIDITYVCEPKIDGIAISLIYEQGVLTCASTRGNGNIGEDVLSNILAIKKIPTKLKTDIPPLLLEVRGEVYMDKETFNRLNEDRCKIENKKFINTRNAAAGSLRQLDPKITATRNLNVFFYSIVQIQGIKLPQKHSEALVILKEFGLNISNEISISSGIKNCLDYYRLMLEKRVLLPYDIDGVVYKVDNLLQQKQLGTTNRFPRWALAHKFPALKVITKILSIDFQVSRKGILTPVARLQPIFVSGATISNVSLHNMHEIIRKDIKIGDMVVIKRSGDVIPKVESVVKEKRTQNEINIIVPKYCPSCGDKINYDENNSYIQCLNHLKCSAQLEQSINHFASKKAMNINGLGDQLIKKLINSGLVKKITDIYSLSINQLMELDNYGEKSALNILKAISQSKQTTLQRFIYSLGIPDVGEVTAKNLATYFRNFNHLMEADYNKLCSISDIGPTTAKKIIDFFSLEYNKYIIFELLKLGVTLHCEKQVISSLSGKIFVLTGVFSTMSRDEVVNELSKLGARVTSSISKKTNYIVVGNNPGSKLDKAIKLKVKIINEKEFLILLKNFNQSNFSLP